MSWVSFGKMKAWYKGYNWVTKKNAAQWIDFFFFFKLSFCETLSSNYWGFFLSTSGYLVYGIEILSFLSSSFVTFSALFQPLPLTTNVLTFSIRRIWNLGTSSYHDTRNCRQTDTCSLYPVKEGLTNVMPCPRDRYILLTEICRSCSQRNSECLKEFV